MSLVRLDYAVEMPMAVGSTHVSHPKNSQSSMIPLMAGGYGPTRSRVETQPPTKPTGSIGYASPTNTRGIRVSKSSSYLPSSQRSPSFEPNAWLSTAEYAWRVSSAQMQSKPCAQKL